MKFKLFIKLFTGFSLLLCSDFAHTFFSWGTRSEIAHILNNSADFTSNPRLSELVQKKRELYWHLRDPYIGVVAQVDQADHSSWNFSLWDYFQQKGKGVKIALIEHGEVEKGDKENILGELRSNIEPEEALGAGDQNHSIKRDRLSFLEQKKCNLGLLHKNVSIDLVLQLAPHAECVIYGIMDEGAFASSDKLQEALSLIASNGFQLTCLGLKVTDKQGIDAIDKELKKIPYVVAASGNDNPEEQEEAYPARSKHVAFSVGSYNRKHHVCEFSQFSTFVGPKLVAPGSEILTQFFRNKYTLTHGTSVSAALIAAFLSLILAEFKDTFTYQEILYIIYNSTVVLHNKKSWKQKVALGAIDMRTAALCFHVLKKIKNKIKPTLFQKSFECLVQNLIRLNEAIATKKTLLQNIHKQLACYADEKDMCSYFEFMTEILLKICNIKSKNRKFQYLFDNKVICLLRNSIKEAVDRPYEKSSNQAKQKIQYALNRQK